MGEETEMKKGSKESSQEVIATVRTNMAWTGAGVNKFSVKGILHIVLVFFKTKQNKKPLKWKAILN